MSLTPYARPFPPMKTGSCCQDPVFYCRNRVKGAAALAKPVGDG